MIYLGHLITHILETGCIFHLKDNTYPLTFHQHYGTLKMTRFLRPPWNRYQKGHIWISISSICLAPIASSYPAVVFASHFRRLRRLEALRRPDPLGHKTPWPT